ncbi:MAG: peptide deformylase [Bacteroidales bacterium]|nr:peptide deformylase [Bacteroidales bacterium]
MILPIYLYGADVLRAADAPVDLSAKEHITTLIADMKETLAKADGCGLAAPQVGVAERILIVDGDCVSDTYDYLKGFRRTMINPVVIEESTDTCIYSEGCLSIPGVYADVTRSCSLTVEYYDENFEKQTETFDKFGARMIQHELDHLDGRMFVDHLAPIRKKMLSKKLFNIQKGKIQTRYKSK